MPTPWRTSFVKVGMFSSNPTNEKVRQTLQAEPGQDGEKWLAWFRVWTAGGGPWPWPERLDRGARLLVAAPRGRRAAMAPTANDTRGTAPDIPPGCIVRNVHFLSIGPGCLRIWNGSRFLPPFPRLLLGFQPFPQTLQRAVLQHSHVSLLQAHDLRDFAMGEAMNEPVHYHITHPIR